MITIIVLFIIAFLIIKGIFKVAFILLNCTGEILADIVDDGKEEPKESFDWYQDDQRDVMDSKAKSNPHIS